LTESKRLTRIEDGDCSEGMEIDNSNNDHCRTRSQDGTIVPAWLKGCLLMAGLGVYKTDSLQHVEAGNERLFINKI
jgi:hypothetical protein